MLGSDVTSVRSPAVFPAPARAELSYSIVLVSGFVFDPFPEAVVRPAQASPCSWRGGEAFENTGLWPTFRSLLTLL